jgi:hypothetical protein
MGSCDLEPPEPGARAVGVVTGSGSDGLAVAASNALRTPPREERATPRCSPVDRRDGGPDHPTDDIDRAGSVNAAVFQADRLRVGRSSISCIEAIDSAKPAAFRRAETRRPCQEGARTEPVDPRIAIRRRGRARNRVATAAAAR